MAKRGDRDRSRERRVSTTVASPIRTATRQPVAPRQVVSSRTHNQLERVVRNKADIRIASPVSRGASRPDTVKLLSRPVVVTKSLTAQKRAKPALQRLGAAPAKRSAPKVALEWAKSPKPAKQAKAAKPAKAPRPKAKARVVHELASSAPRDARNKQPARPKAAKAAVRKEEVLHCKERPTDTRPKGRGGSGKEWAPWCG